jgi:acyl phosphate:glycerol-3-phosphate acyltransferase
VNPLLILSVLLAGYLLGSIPSGWLAGRWCAGVDLRQLGSGSTGATNVLRQVGKGPALVVFLVDVLKGTAAVLLAKAVVEPLGVSAAGDAWVVAAGLAALAGHIWPVWLGWRGGKAVATGLGVLLGLVPAVGLPLLMLGSFQSAGTGLRPAYLALALLTTVLVLWRHRSNLARIMDGTEPRIGADKPNTPT